MASIDERVVSMSFENARFEAGVAQTLASLNKLSAGLSQVGNTQGFADIDRAASRVTLDGPSSALDRLRAKLGLVGANAGQGFSEIDSAANKVSLSGLNGAIDTVVAKFSTIQAAASVAMGNIASQAVMSGAAFVKSFALGPITQGLDEYTTNLNSIQTILANTQSSGADLNDVNGALQELNHYSDQTIYNFSEMAKNIGTFTAAGVELGPATQSIKGIANLAALSGSNSQQASTAMYQLSQAIAAGRVNLQDWNSVVNAGMGGKVFQKALFDTGKAMGTITNSPVGQTFKEWEKAGNSFRQSLSATNKAATDGAAAIRKARKDAAESIVNAEESAAQSVENASDRVKDAQKGVAEAAKRTAEAVANAQEQVKAAQEGVAETAKRAGESLKNAQDGVKEAQRGVAESAKQSAENVKAAVRAQKDAIKQSADDVASALDGVRNAQKRLADALKPPSNNELEAAADAAKTAQLDQADTSSAVTDAQREQKRSAEDLAAAQKKLGDLKSSGASADEIAAATRTVEDAQRRATDASDAQERALLRQRAAARGVTEAQQELAELQKKGTEEDENVKDSRDALTQALDNYSAAQKRSRDVVIAAEKDVKQARKDSAKAQEEAAKRLIAAEESVTEARKNGARAQADASKRLVEAEKNLTEARSNGAESQKEASERLVDAQKAEVKATKDAQKQIAEAHEQAAERIKAAQAASKPQAAGGPPSWLTSDVLTKTLQQFTGDMTDAQLKAQGFTAEQIKQIQTMAQTAQKSATEVKTLSGVLGVAREALGSGWSETFKGIFGNFGEAKKTFTDLSQYIGGFITRNADARNKVVAEWRKMGGRNELIEGFKSLFTGILSIITPIKDAFREIFPPATGAQLADLTKKFRDFADAIRLSPETADALKRTFAGLFAVLHIGVSIVKGVVGVIADLIGVAGEGSGGFLNFTGSIGDFLVALDNALTKGGALTGFFDGLTAVLRTPLRLLGLLASAFFGLFGDADSSKATEFGAGLDKVTAAASPLRAVLDTLGDAWDKLGDVLDRIKTAITPWLGQAAAAFSDFGSIISDAFSNMNFDGVFAAIQTGLIGGIFLAIRKALSGGLANSLGGGILDNINNTFKALTGNLEVMQQNVKANVILKIAAAIGVLAAAVLVLSQINPEDLQRAMGAVAVGLGELIGALALLSKVAKGGAFLTMPILAASLIGLSVAVLLLAGAVKIFSTMSWEDLAKGLIGVGGALAAVGLGTKLIGPNVAISALALIPMAIAINLLALAVKQFAGISWEDMGKGLIGVAGSLVAIGASTSLFGPSLLLVGPGLVAAAFAMSLLAAAVGAFANMDLARMTVGIIGMGAALAAIGLAVGLIPPTVGLQAAGLVLLSVALMGIAGAIATMGSMNIAKMAKGIASLAAVLVVLGIGLSAMTGTLGGSVALLAAAAALAVLAPTLALLGSLDVLTIVKGLAAIAGVFTVLAIAGLAASAPIAALGIALLPFAGLMLAAGVAALAFGKALQLMGDNGAKAVAATIAALLAFVASIPKIVITFVSGLVEIVKSIQELAPKLLTAIGAMLTTIINFVAEQAPQLALAIGIFLDAFLTVVTTNAPKIIAAGFQLLLDFLTGIANNIEKVVEHAVLIVTRFITTLAENAPKLVASGLTLLVNFLAGIAANIGKAVAAAANVVTHFLDGITEQLPKVVAAGVKMIITFLNQIANNIPKVIGAGTNVIVKFLEGIGDNLPKIVKAGVDLVIRFVNAIADAGPRLADAGFKAVIKFLHGIADAIRNNEGDLIAAGIDIAKAIVEGLVDGLGQVGHLVKGALMQVIDVLPGFAKKILGIHSPSTVFAEIGRFTMLGMAKGITDGSVNANQALEKSGSSLVKTAAKTMGSVPDILAGMTDLNPVITPVLDLTEMRKGVGEMGSLSGTSTLTPVLSSASAMSISHETSANREAVTGSMSSGAAGTVVKFEQNNYSPESLSDVEIYRQTRNQLSQLKFSMGMNKVGL